MMNIDAFRAETYERRTATVPVPALSKFFPEGSDSELVVQSLTGPEVFRAEERKDSNTAIDVLVRKLVGQDQQEKVDAALGAMGLGGDALPARLVKAIAFVEFGVREPSLTQADAVRLAEYHIDTFLALFRKIDQLTALGHVSMGELNASGQTNVCETPSPSAPEAGTDTDSSSK